MKYNYDFCVKAANYFFERGNYKLFDRFYRLVKQMQADQNDSRCGGPK